MRKTLLVFLGAAAAAGFAAPVQAQHWQDREWRSIRVDASALDLSTPAGVDALEDRIDRAVRRICGSDWECRDEAWASTDAQVAYAIDRDRWTRRMAAEREAQLAACGWDGCAPPAPAYYAPPPPPAAYGGVTVTIVYAAPPARVVYYAPGY